MVYLQDHVGSATPPHSSKKTLRICANLTTHLAEVGWAPVPHRGYATALDRPMTVKSEDLLSHDCCLNKSSFVSLKIKTKKSAFNENLKSGLEILRKL